MVGQTIGRYKILNLLGKGGMGQVYHAEDTSLGRPVALKFLAAHLLNDSEAKQRFLREAKAAAAITHPNIRHVYEVGEENGKTFLAMAFLEGESLENRIAAGPLPLKDVLDISRQIAEGLDAAHEKGIVHRDIKPANVMVDSKGHATILDFGLARLTEASKLTRPDQTVGTAAYMSPEQMQGGEVDHRTDVWALGCVLYEVVAGTRPFPGAYAQALAFEIVNEQPEPLTGVRAGVPMELELIVAKCLEKDPNDRYSGAADVALDLRRVARGFRSGGGSTVRSAAAPDAPEQASGRHSRPRAMAAILAGAALLAVAALSFVAGARLATPDPPGYTRLTFKRGNITGARFAPSGDEIIYSAAWDGGPVELYSTRTGAVSSRPLGIQEVDIQAISKTGEMALRERTGGQWRQLGTLYTAPLAGGPPRAVLDDVFMADWTPDGELGVIRTDDKGQRLEVPIGSPRYAIEGLARGLRIAPDGRIALAERGDGFGANWDLLVFNSDGPPQRNRIPGAGSTVAMSWDPNGDGVWYESGELGADQIFMLEPGGDSSLVLGIPGQMRLLDTSPNGRVLINRSESRAGIRCRPPGESSEREISWLDFADVNDMTADGKTMLISEFGEADGFDTWAVYLRDTDGSPPISLGDGQGVALSPDGGRALTFELGDPPQLVIRPTGPGELVRLPNPGFTGFNGGDWHPDGERIIFLATKGGSARLYIQDLIGGEPQPITPGGVQVGLGQRVVSPDGKWVLAETVQGEVVVYPIEGGEGKTLPLPRHTRPFGWSSDSASVHVGLMRWGETMKLSTVRLADGEGQPFMELSHPDPAGVVAYWGFQIADNGQSYCYSYMRDLSALYLVEGLR